MLHLAIRFDLALQLDELLGARIDPAQNVEPDGPHHDQKRHDCEECRQQLDLHASRHPRDQADERVHHSHCYSLRRLRRSRRNSSGSKRTPRYCTRRMPCGSTIDVRNVCSTSPFCGLRRIYAVAARYVLDRRRGAGQEAPAGEIGAERLRVLLEHLGRVALRVDGDGNESDLGAEITPELILHERHHRRQNGASGGAQGEYEGHRDHLAAEVRECNPCSVLRGQRKFRRRCYLRQRRLQRRLLRGVARKRQQETRRRDDASQATG